jgi:hypothetical protein
MGIKMSTKKEDLEKLDKLVREKMIECLEGGKTDMLPELNPVVSYLAKNNVVSEKSKSSVEEDIKDKLKKAKERRDKREEEEDEL